LYLSGLTAALSGMLACKPAGWATLAWRRAQRLLVPFFAVGLAILLAKLALARVLPVDNAPAGLAAGLTGLFWATAHSPALSLWYLPVLFTLSLTGMALGAARPGRMKWLFAAALVLYILPVPPVITRCFFSPARGPGCPGHAGSAASTISGRGPWRCFSRR
jgi:fucose 4-O-acetylase-like acetyltransferase